SLRAFEGWQFQLGRGRVPRCLRECADGADLEGHLRGPHQGKLRQGAGRLCLRQSAEAGTADRPSVLGAGGRPDHAEGNHVMGDLPGRAASMKTWQLMALHAAAAATFIFLLQRYALSASLESALLW